jgi:hypothetical protein
VVERRRESATCGSALDIRSADAGSAPLGQVRHPYQAPPPTPDVVSVARFPDGYQLVFGGDDPCPMLRNLYKVAHTPEAEPKGAGGVSDGK